MIPADTICAVSTPPGSGAIAVIRVSGPQALPVVSVLFRPAVQGVSVVDCPGGSLFYGRLYEGDECLDEVVVTVFRAPRSYTGEDVAEISCHGSSFIQQTILEALLRRGIRLANRGEYTQRAFLNGKMDLSQAEAVADLIASHSAASRRVALQQMRGGFSAEISEMRNRLVSFAALLELELDFSEEDVEFADRSRLLALLDELDSAIARLLRSFRAGNVLKEGVPVVIAGKPNTGKSTLLNALLNEEKAIVTELAGTTRDVIEDTLLIDDMLFRFVDTAGLRHSADPVEAIGIGRTYERLGTAAIVLYLIDAPKALASGAAADTDSETAAADVGVAVAAGAAVGAAADAVTAELEALFAQTPSLSNCDLFLLFNKADKADPAALCRLMELVRHPLVSDTMALSASQRTHLDCLHTLLLAAAHRDLPSGEATVVTNLRHFEALSLASESLTRLRHGLTSHLSGEFLAQELRETLHHLGAITGKVANGEILEAIFSRFCIGK
ncbi:MAG: tRNA uridine-5-carboxymethylaminomethyl(34) synthesis GTPase MnmE [Bacteroidales bacterium]